MKSKVWSFYKITFINNYNINKKNKDKVKGKSKANSGTLATTFIYVFLIIFSAIYSVLGFNILKENNLQNYFPIIVYIITSLVILWLSIKKSKSIIFDSRFNDVIFSMPISSKNVLLARILSLLTMNYITTTAIMIPALLIFGLCMNMTALYYIFSLFIIIFTPFLPVLLASCIGYLIAFLTSKVKSCAKIFETIITFIIFGIFILFSYCGNKIIFVATQNLEKIDIFINKYGFVLKYINNALIDGNVISFVKFIFINFALLVILIWIFSFNFFKISSKLNENKSNRKVRKNVAYQKNSILKTLTIKEIKYILSIPTYIFNSLMGAVMLFLLSIATFFFSGEKILALVGWEELGASFGSANIAFCMITFLIGLSITTCSSISLEGKKFWQIKSLPIDLKKVINSKILANVILVMIPAIISIPIICINFKLSILETILLFLIAATLNLVASQLGLLTNLRFPKLNYESEIQAIKQSKSTFISTFGMMIFVIILIGISFVLSNIFEMYIAMIIILLVLTIIAIIQRISLNTSGIKKLQNLSI